MGRHDLAKKGKKARNARYAERYRQRTCENCSHRSCISGKCKICGGKMKSKGIP